MQIPDLLWKEIIEDLFEDFTALFLQDLYPDIAFSKGFEFLDKELASLFPESESAKRHVDKLVKVFLNDGRESWILIHVEIQGYKDEDFSRRMFTYFYRIFDKYQKEVVALAIFTDKYNGFRPDSYKYSFFGTELIYKYRTYKILDQNEKELEKIDNPFALVVLSGLYAIKSKKDLDVTYSFKLKLMRLLLEKGYTKEKIEKVFIFIDGLLLLPKGLELKFKEEVKNMIGGKKKMGLTAEMSNIGQIAFKEGKKEGKKEGLRKGLLEGIQLALDIKFGIEGLSLMDKIEKIKNIDILLQIKEVIRKSKHINEIKALL